MRSWVAGIDPLDVLDHRQHRRIGPEPGEEAEDALEQPRPIDGVSSRAGAGPASPSGPARRRGADPLRPSPAISGTNTPRSSLRRAEQLQRAVGRHGPDKGPQGLDERQVRQPLALEVETPAVEDR